MRDRVPSPGVVSRALSTTITPASDPSLERSALSTRITRVSEPRSECSALSTAITTSSDPISACAGDLGPTFLFPNPLRPSRSAGFVSAVSGFGYTLNPGRARRMTSGTDNEKRRDCIWLEETASRALLVAWEDEGG
jgi:hypothetical protein